MLWIRKLSLGQATLRLVGWLVGFLAVRLQVSTRLLDLTLLCLTAMLCFFMILNHLTSVESIIIYFFKSVHFCFKSFWIVGTLKEYTC